MYYGLRLLESRLIITIAIKKHEQVYFTEKTTPTFSQTSTSKRSKKK
jgi:hypothetical protein